MEGKGISKDNDAPQSLNVVQNFVPLIGSTPVSAVAGSSGSVDGQEKRGSPCENESGSKAVLSPLPMLSGTPLTQDFSASKRGEGSKRGRSSARISNYRRRGTHYKHHKFTVNAGQDIAKRIFYLAQKCPAIVFLSAHGTISSATFQQSDSSGEISNYQGNFQLISLSGSFLPCNDGRYKKKGTVAVSLALANGEHIGGVLADSLIAAGPVEVLACSFLP